MEKSPLPRWSSIVYKIYHFRSFDQVDHAFIEFVYRAAFRLNSREKRKFTRKKFQNFEWLYAGIRDKFVEIYPSKIVDKIKIKIGDEKWGSWTWVCLNVFV